MNIRRVRAAILFSCLPLAGCGTIANVVTRSPELGGMVPFGGVKEDVAFITADNNLNISQNAAPGSYASTLVMILTTLDLPLSLVGDILTWPYVEAYTLVNGKPQATAYHPVNTSAVLNPVEGSSSSSSSLTPLPSMHR